MKLDLAGKVILVTGASAGIGLATARAFASEGCHVMLCARDEARLSAAAAQVAAAATGGEAATVSCDLRTVDGPERAVEATVRRFGALDVLVNNAAPNPMGVFSETPDEAMLASLMGKPIGYARAARAAIPALRRRGGGVIVNVAGMSAHHVTHAYAIGTLSTTGLHGFTKVLAEELGGEGIRVVSIDPGVTETEHFRTSAVERLARERGVGREQVLDEFLRTIPLRRFAQPAEIADAIVFLASARAAYITGVSLLVDGGRSRGVL